MAIILAKRLKMVLLAGFMMVSVTSYGQDALHNVEMAVLDMRRVEAEIELVEREVAVYDKDIRKNEHIQEKMKDKEHRLKYKVMSEISKMDTTVPHKMTYKEWKLEKAQRERAHATTQLAKAQQARQEKVLYLGGKTQELELARQKAAIASAEFKKARIQDKDTNTKASPSADKDKKLRRNREPGYIQTR